MPPAARVGDLTSHGTPLGPGPGSPTVLIGGEPAWCAEVDTHACPLVNGAQPHVGGVVAVMSGVGCGGGSGSVMHTPGTTPGKLARALSGPYPISDTAMRRATLLAAVDVQDSAAVDH